MRLIDDKDGVQVVIPPVLGDDGIMQTIDFNFSEIELEKLDHKVKAWSLQLFDDKKAIAKVKFKAFQFIACGVERRTISVSHMELIPQQRGKGRSYDLMEFIIARVTKECDKEWGEVSGKPVLFIETLDIKHLPQAQQKGLLSLLKKVGEKVLGINHHDQSPPEHDIGVTVIGDDITMMLIKEHLIRSSIARKD
jgi:hypothetical protein